LIYEWEDGHLIDDAVRQCRSFGRHIAQIAGAGVPMELRRLAPHLEIGILWTQAAQASPEVAAALLSAAATGHGVTYMVRPDSPLPPAEAAVVELRLSSPPNSLSRPER
jgi:hypothetical protein